MSMSKDERRSRYERRKPKHVRDIRHDDYIGNERDEVTRALGRNNHKAVYNVVKGKDKLPITRGGGMVMGNPRYSHNRSSVMDTIDQGWAD